MMIDVLTLLAQFPEIMPVAAQRQAKRKRLDEKKKTTENKIIRAPQYTITQGNGTNELLWYIPSRITSSQIIYTRNMSMVSYRMI